MSDLLRDYQDSVIAHNVIARVKEATEFPTPKAREDCLTSLTAGFDDSRQNIDRLERLVSAVEDHTSILRSAFDQYRHDPDRMAPQLDNMRRASSEIGSNLRVIGRTLDSITKK